uniref:Uncharacterized protein n=1 Tax=viral metagenome TaxID=1070528 RepID=A0A6C0HLA7_9ZZZZ
MSAFKLAKKRTVPEIAADLARLKREEKELRHTLKHSPRHVGAKTALITTWSEIEHTKREKGVPKRAGRRTVKRTKMDRRRRR